MLRIARAIPVSKVKYKGKTHYSISVGNEIVWVHHALIENNMLVLRGKRFYFDMHEESDGSYTYYLYPGKYKITALQSMKYLYVLDGYWIASEHNGAFYYFIVHDDETLIVHNRIKTFEIRDNKIVSVERLDAYERVERDTGEIDLDGAF